MSAQDRAILRSQEIVAEGIAKLIGSHCEVIVHSLEDPAHSVVKIMNGQITGRKVGSPLTDLALQMLQRQRETGEDVIGPYLSQAGGGRTFQSITMSIRGSGGRLIGFLCVNIDLSVSLKDLLSAYMPQAGADPAPREFLPATVDDLVHRALREEFARTETLTGVAPVERNRMIVRALNRKGLFDVKGVVEKVAREMGISKFSIYNYIKNEKGQG